MDDFNTMRLAGEYGEFIVGVNENKETRGLLIVPWILGVIFRFRRTTRTHNDVTGRSLAGSC